MQILDLFKELSIHPKNVEELKGLILQLAVQGKLTAKWREEHPDVEHASELLKRIQSEKQQLIKEKKIRKEKPLPPIIKDEQPFELSDKWDCCRLRDIGVTQTGSTPPKKNINFYGDFIPFLGPADISYNSMEYPKEGLSELGLQKGRLIPKNSLMMVCIGGSIGKCNINKIDVSCNQQINTITPIYSLVGYIKSICQSSLFQNELLKKSTGSATPIINKGKWESIIVPLPPLEEQKAIISIVNHLMEEVEQLKQLTKTRIQLKDDFASSALHRLVTTDDTPAEWSFMQEYFSDFFTETSTVKKLRDTILQLAVQGKLTTKWREENPDTEPASELLKKIHAEKQQLIKGKKIKKEKPLSPIKEEEKPFELPEGWVWCRMGLVSDIIAGASFKSGDFNQRGGVKCIKITNAGVREFVETNDYLPNGFDKKYSNYLIKEGDLILALTRPYIKEGLKISTCPPSYHKSLLNQRVASIRSISDSIFHPYIFSFLQSPLVLTYYKSMFDNKSQQPNMKMKDISELLVSLPALEEQKAIVEKVNALMSLCDELEHHILNRQGQVEDLMLSCVKEVEC